MPAPELRRFAPSLFASALETRMNTTVLGAGAWGTALALLLHRNGHAVTLWGHDPAQLADVAATRRNPRHLAGVELPADWRMEPDARAACAGAELVVMAVPSRGVRATAPALSDYAGLVVSVTKGIEFDTGLTMSGVIESVAPRATVVALSGPTLAAEVARGLPAAVVVAGADETAARVQAALHQPVFRVYRNPDRLGVELGGALKNVIAIAAGACDGLGYGDNAKAALLTRGAAEMRRLGVACGAQAETFAGLSGLGDLTVTCFSPLSRNRTLGERLGRGERLADIIASTRAVAEGVPTSTAALRLAERRGVDTPIIREVEAMLHRGKDLRRAVHDLLRRDSKAED